jgi:hypothetical protein
VESLASDKNKQDLQPHYNRADCQEQPIAEDPLEDVQRLVVLSTTAECELDNR